MKKFSMQRKQYKNMLSSYSFTKVNSLQYGSHHYIFQSKTKTNRTGHLAVFKFRGDEKAILSFPYWVSPSNKDDICAKPNNWKSMTELGLALTKEFIWDKGADKSSEVFDFEFKEEN